MIEVVYLEEHLIASHSLEHTFASPLDTIKEDMFNMALDGDGSESTGDLLTTKFVANFAKLRDIIATADKHVTASFTSSK